MYRHILVPVDDSDLSVDTVAQAVEFAKRLEARITFVHARGDYGATDAGALLHAMAPDEYVQAAAGHARAVLARAEVEASRAGVPYHSVIKTSDHPHEVIVDVAEDEGCDLIFMASRGRTGLRGLLQGSQTRQVLAHASVPVLVSSVQSNRRCPDMTAAIATIKGEHRSLAAVIKGFEHAIERARTTGAVLDPRLLEGILLYFRRFTVELHHPKEEAYLFERLRKVNRASAEAIEALEAQHQQEPALLADIESAAKAYGSVPDAEQLEAIATALKPYAEHLWAHMMLEEQCILPDCRSYLSASDWREIHRAFEANGDPRFDEDRDAGFERLFVRIMNLVEEPI